MSIPKPQRERAPGALLLILTTLACGPDRPGPVAVVAQPAEIAISSTELSFDLTEGDEAPPLVELVITNAGERALVGLAVDARYEGTAEWLELELMSTSAPAIVRVRVVADVLTEGVHEAGLVVSAVGAPNSPQVVAIQARVEAGPEPPLVMLSDDEVALEVSEGQARPDTVNVAVSNGGELPLTGLRSEVVYAENEAEGWLVAVLTRTHAPASVRLALADTPLRPGSYHADVVISAAESPPDTIRVGLVVRPVPSVLRLETNEYTLETNEGAPNPPVGRFEIISDGAGTLVGLEASVEYAESGPSGWMHVHIYDDEGGPELSVSYLVDQLPEGRYEAVVSVVAANAENGPQELAITVEMGAPTGYLHLGIGSIIYTTAEYGGPDPEPIEIEITNWGEGTLDDLVAAVVPNEGSEGDWVSAELAGPLAPTVLTLTISLDGLYAGSYYADLTVTTPDAGNSPVERRVTLVVTGGAADLTVEGTAPMPQQVRPGERVTVPAHTLANIGSARSEWDFLVGVFLSPDADVTPDDVSLGEAGFSWFRPGQRWPRPEFTVEVPPDTRPGSYTMGVLIDSGAQVSESDETNNVLTFEVTVVPPGGSGRGG